MEKPHEKLKVWQMAVDLAVDIYKITEKFPRHELYGLANQMRRSAISIPCNLAEGAARKSDKEFLQFLNIAKGSVSELDTQLEISEKLDFISFEARNNLDQRLSDIDKMLSGLVKRHRERP